MISEWHAISSEEALRELETSRHGLTHQEAAQRLERFGLNVLPKSDAEGAWKILIRQFRSPFIYILLASSALAFFLGKQIDSMVVLSVVLINAIIGFVQEFKAGKAIEALSAMVPEKVRVIRDGQVDEVDSIRLVPGDIVQIQSGDKVAADIRLLQAKNLRIEEAALTGESVPTEKNSATLPGDALVGDRTNMAFSGTLVTFGQGVGVVAVTGGATELGRIAKMLKSTTEIETPLTKSMESIGKILTLAISVIALVLLAIGLARGFPLVDALLASITLAVAAIPEGLPAIITIALAIGVRRMASRCAVMRRLPAVETLGSTTVICSDKTGTLTKNEMTVQGVWTPLGAFQFTGVGYKSEGKILKDGVAVQSIPDELAEVLRAGVLCNDAEIVNEDGKYRVQGDPTEGSLIVAFEKAGGVAEALKGAHRRVDSIPFESERQYMATLNENEDGERYIYLKGAPEVVLRAAAIADRVAHEARHHLSHFAELGMRVLALARKPTTQSSLSESDVEAGGFELLGLQAMIDPPRPEVIRSIAACHRAGIIVKMITGDHQETAKAIAHQLNIDNGQAPLTGAALAAMSDQELEDAAVATNVFARVAPEHKLRLVRALQRRGHVTAMTGDGVNDAPALKQADIGVAMGITGTSVSKESADLVLVDDNFATIEAAVEEGRRIYDNLIKSLAFVLPTNLGLAFIILIAVAFFPMVGGHPIMPILPVQILWINLVASVALALPLALEAKEPNVMSRPPRDPSEPVLGAFVLWRTVLVASMMAAGAILLFLYEYNLETGRGIASGQALREAQTIAVTTMIFIQIFYLLACRSLKDSVFQIGLFSNPSVYFGIGLLLVLQFAFVHMEIMNTLFGSAPLPLDAWGRSAIVGASVLPVIGVEKILRHVLSK